MNMVTGTCRWASAGQAPLHRFTPRQVKPDPTPLLTSRHNVFQNDEFDVFSRDSVDLSRVHKGRR